MMPNSPPPLEYATKADLALLRQEMRADLALFRQEMRADLAELKADIRQTVITSQIATTAIFGTLVTILKLFG